MIIKGYGSIIAAAILWGMIGPFSRLAFQEGLSPMEIAFWRASLSWIIFGAHAAIRQETRLDKKDFPYIIIFGFCGVTLFYFCYQTAVLKGGAALAAVLLYTTPAWVVCLSRFFYKEHISSVKILAVVLTLAGVTSISLGENTHTVCSLPAYSAIIFGLLSGCCYSLYYLFGKYFSSRYSSANLFLYILPVGVAGMLPWVTFTHKTPTAWLALGLLVIISTYGANTCYYYGLKYLEAGHAAIAATLEPVIAAAVAYFWWHEAFTALRHRAKIT